MKHLLLLLTSFCLFQTAQATIDTIEVSDFQYTPASLEITLGDTIRFIWVEGNHPTVSGEAGTPDNAFTTISINSDNVQADLVLETPGSYPYYCAFHFESDSMMGEINVVATSLVEDCGDLFFSEYIEGEGTNKALELYNPTEESINLSEYSIKRYNNGNTMASYEGSLEGVIEAGSTFLITHSDADATLLSAANLLNIDMVLFNGNDAMALYKGNQLLDVVGQIGDDPGIEWEIGNFGTENGTLVRNPDVLKGQTDWNIGITEWSSYPEDEFQFVGNHNNNTCFTISSFECSELFFSEYIEGTGNHTALEIFNPTSTTIDLTPYTIERYNNASTMPSFVEDLTGTIPPFTTFVLANPSAGTEVTAVANLLSEATIFSGNDAIVLSKDGTTIDQIGEIGDNPGVFWEVGEGGTTDYTLVRKYEINEGTDNWATGSTQWDIYPLDTYDQLGSHINHWGSSNPQISFLNDFAFVEEDEGAFLLGFQLAGFTDEPESLDLVLVSGTAEEGSDFIFMDTTLVLDENTETPLFISIPILNDEIEEEMETILFSLTNASGNVDLNTPEFTLNIQDDDAPLPLLDIVEVRDIDADGVTLDLGLKCELRGIVYGGNLQNVGVQFTLIDPTSGITVYDSGNPAIDYTVTEGDSVHVEGEIQQFRGLTQIRPSKITLISSDNPIKEPRLVEVLDESTESDVIKLECITLIDPSEWTPGVGSGFSVRAHNSSGEFIIRIDDQVDLFNQNAPQTWFTISGTGSQFSTTSQGPFLDGYQVIPRNFSDVKACGAVGIETIEETTNETITVYPNPSADWLQLNSKDAFGEINITDLRGQLVLSKRILPQRQTQLNVSELSNGIYIIQLIGKDVNVSTKFEVLK